MEREQPVDPKVIELFGQRPEDAAEAPEASPAESHERDARLNADRLADVLFFLSALAKADNRSLNQRNIDVRQQGLAQTANEELYRLVNHSTERDWQAHPSHFHAIIAELEARDLMPRPSQRE